MTEPIFTRRSYLDIDLSAVKANYRTACSLTDALVTCVVKSNAYGHGAVRVAQALQEAGCRSFAVSCAREALELRRAGIAGEILIMGLCDEDRLAECLARRVTLTAASESDLRAMERAAAEAGVQAQVHLKVNTGFHRLGIDCTEEAAAAIARCAHGLPHVRVAGLYTHLGLINEARDIMQHQGLMTMHGWLSSCGLAIEDVHICDSIGLVRYPAWHHRRVRVGALLFGVRPSRTEDMDYRCLETLTFHTQVAQVHEVAAGEIVGYGDDMILTRDSRIATLCVGYGDGYPRHLSNGVGKVLIRGRLAPVVGLVCMDQMMVDVTDIPEVAAGDDVVLLGGGISYQQYADWGHTNRNECISILSRRPVRVYREKGRIVTILDSMLEERRDFT